MGVSETQQKAPQRRKPRARPQFARRYQPFVPPQGVSAGEVGRSHLSWVLANMYRFALAGRANPNTIGLALQRDLELLAGSPEPEQTPAPTPIPPDLAALEEKCEQLQQAYMDVYCKVSDVRMKLYGLLKVLGDETMRRPEVKAAYFELQGELEKIRYQHS